MNATPQTIPVAQLGLLAPLAVLAAGVGLLLAAVLPPLLGRRRRTPHPILTRGSPR